MQLLCSQRVLDSVGKCTVSNPRASFDGCQRRSCLLFIPLQLYELMIMAFKYQVFHCPRPKDLLLISYNHIDAARELVKDTPAVVNKVDETHRKIIEVYQQRLTLNFNI